MRSAGVIFSVLVMTCYFGFRAFATFAILPLAEGFDGAFWFSGALLASAGCIAVLVLTPYRRFGRWLNAAFLIAALVHWWIMDVHRPRHLGLNFLWFVFPEVAFSAAVLLFSGLHASELRS